MTDLDLLDEAEDSGKLSERQLEIIDDLRDQLARRPLTPNQRSFVEAMRDGVRYEREEAAVPASAFPRGNPVELPEVLRKLPKRPPGRSSG
jgi:hypothetical protein